jgi:hypothetical protein
MTEPVDLTEQEASSADKKRYKEVMDRARAGSRNRPIGPPRENMPTFESIERSKTDPPPRPDIPTMSADELSARARRAPAEKGTLRQETVEGLKALQEANAAPTVGASVPEPAPSPPDEEDEPEIEDLDAPDVEAAVRQFLNTSAVSPVARVYDEARRDLIEKNLSPLSISSVLISQDARQAVPVAEEAVVEFRTLNGHETDFIEDYIWRRYSGNLTRLMYDVAKSLCALTLSIVKVGDTRLPEARNKFGEIDEKKFENKWRALMRYPGFFLEAMDINRVWFSERCANMLSVESVGNG